MTLIDIAEIHPPRAGGKVSKIVAESGEKYEIWPDKLDGVTVGRSYMVEIREREYQGRTISSITKIAPTPQVPAARAPTTAAPASPSTGEAQYVGLVLAALIAKGEVEKTSIAAATQWLRRMWREGYL
jgi:hypothetical protein